jgi:hypothetical protein
LKKCIKRVVYWRYVKENWEIGGLRGGRTNLGCKVRGGPPCNSRAVLNLNMGYPKVIESSTLGSE